jgi:monofunctional biosynthetic peptidoglycan transglycosylase
MKLRPVAVALAAVPVLAAAWVVAGLPARGDVRALAKGSPGKTSVMRQREEEARRAGRAPRTQQAYVPLSRISKHLIHAVIASEDQKFFGHEGVDWEAVEKVIEEDRRRFRFARGGSTITQQLAKNLFFTTHRSVARKLREVVVADWLEDDLGKRRILELYLNVIEWGDGVYGAQAAALRYYGKPASALDEVEAAGLAAMIPNPRRINPRVNAGRHARAQRRVLWLMKGAGYLRRDIGGLGAEPPPEEVEEEDDEAPAAEDPGPSPPAAPSVEPPAPATAAPDAPTDDVPPAEPADAPLSPPPFPDSSPPSR